MDRDDIVENALIEEILSAYRNELAEDFFSYRNHAQRVYNYCLLLSKEVLSPKDKNILAISAAFHDLGIWTHNTFDYLRPSISLAANYLTSQQKPAWVEEVSVIIDMHHKITIYAGSFKRNAELFRRADWLDVTCGARSFGMPIKDFRAVLKFPYRGFHMFLIKRAAKNFLKHPLRPLPMFKK